MGEFLKFDRGKKVASAKLVGFRAFTWSCFQVKVSSSLKKVREERGLRVISQPVTPGMKDTSDLDQNTLGKYNRVFWSKQ